MSLVILKYYSTKHFLYRQYSISIYAFSQTVSLRSGQTYIMVLIDSFRSGHPVQAFSYADWAGDLTTRRSTTRYYIYLGLCPSLRVSRNKLLLHKAPPIPSIASLPTRPHSLYGSKRFSLTLEHHLLSITITTYGQTPYIVWQ